MRKVDVTYRFGAPEVLNLDEDALAPPACFRDGGKVERHGLLAHAARELRYPNLMRKVRRVVLSKTLNVENNAGGLRTDGGSSGSQARSPRRAKGRAVPMESGRCRVHRGGRYCLG